MNKKLCYEIKSLTRGYLASVCRALDDKKLKIDDVRQHCVVPNKFAKKLLHAALPFRAAIDNSFVYDEDMFIHPITFQPVFGKIKLLTAYNNVVRASDAAASLPDGEFEMWQVETINEIYNTPNNPRLYHVGSAVPVSLLPEGEEVLYNTPDAAALQDFAAQMPFALLRFDETKDGHTCQTFIQTQKDYMTEQSPTRKQDLDDIHSTLEILGADALRYNGIML